MFLPGWKPLYKEFSTVWNAPRYRNGNCQAGRMLPLETDKNRCSIGSLFWLMDCRAVAER